jgi:hypothetical protein
MGKALPLWKRLVWMGAIWIASLFALGVVTAVSRLFLKG